MIEVNALSDIASRVEEIMSDLMSEDVLPVRERTWINCSQWDSVFQLNLITSIEQEFHLRITDEEAAELTSFETAVWLVEEKQKRVQHAE